MQKNSRKYKFKSKVWLYSSPKSSWHFVSVPEDISAEIKFLNSCIRRGWGAIKCSSKIGKTLWKTSIFPDSKSKTYLLPIKKEVREKENITIDKIVNIVLEI
ncbi:MAG: DUF1905 domain-containing protein [Rickettsiales bacterium]|nr:DUF1905 domain-containing protein [Rickettsiales bacterium]